MIVPTAAPGAVAAGSDAEEFRRALDATGSLWVRVSGDCMAPTVRDDQWVRVRRRSSHRVGDVALLDASGCPELHRLVDRIAAGPDAWYVHVGDNSDAPGLAAARDLLGVVEVSRPRRKPAWRAHLWGLGLKLGVFLWYLGLPCPPGALRRAGRALKGAALARA